MISHRDANHHDKQIINVICCFLLCIDFSSDTLHSFSNLSFNGKLRLRPFIQHFRTFLHALGRDALLAERDAGPVDMTF